MHTKGNFCWNVRPDPSFVAAATFHIRAASFAQSNVNSKSKLLKRHKFQTHDFLYDWIP